ncbi:hypothetical protein NL436_28720, partial [Klebsiella pneumoniae]|nr:hypothetical protein [Klebsiella pneumoniae]
MGRVAARVGREAAPTVPESDPRSGGVALSGATERGAGGPAAAPVLHLVARCSGLGGQTRALASAAFEAG